MAKQPHEPPPSNNSAMAILVVGILLVGGLVAWALTRTVDVAPTPAPAQEAPVAVATAPLTTETAASNTPPITMTSTSPVTMTTPPAPSVAEHDNTQEKQAIPRLSAEDLRAKVNRNDVTVIDVRDAESFKTAHIPGALHIQFASLEGMIDTIPKGKPIVLYCT